MGGQARNQNPFFPTSHIRYRIASPFSIFLAQNLRLVWDTRHSENSRRHANRFADLPSKSCASAGTSSGSNLRGSGCHPSEYLPRTHTNHTRAPPCNARTSPFVQADLSAVLRSCLQCGPQQEGRFKHEGQALVEENLAIESAPTRR